MFVEGDIHTNTVESFWAIAKRAFYGTYHRISVKYLQEYTNEFSFRYNHRNIDKSFDCLIDCLTELTNVYKITKIFFKNI